MNPYFSQSTDRIHGDPLNQDIWQQSPTTMAMVHGIRSDGVCFDGFFGCQQAMVGEEAMPQDGPRLLGCYDPGVDWILPWIPDWIGSRSRSSSGVTVIGSSYPSVLHERNPYSAGLSLEEYRESPNADAFLDLFSEKILVGEDSGPFCGIESLLFPMREAADVCLFQLCRGSYVTRRLFLNEEVEDFEDSDLGGHHIQDPGMRRLYRLLYGEYLEASEHWNWTRLKENTSGALIALGAFAAQRVLKMFHDRGAGITSHENGRPWMPTPEDLEAPPVNHGDVMRGLYRWIGASGRWWDIRMADGRAWRLLPVFPLDLVMSSDIGYRRTRRVLPAFLDGV